MVSVTVFLRFNTEQKSRKHMQQNTVTNTPQQNTINTTLNPNVFAHSQVKWQVCPYVT